MEKTKLANIDAEAQAVEEASRLTAELQDEYYEEYEQQDLPPPPDGGYGWVIVLASFVCNMIVDGIAYTFGIFLNDFVDYFHEGKGTVAWVGSLLSGVYLSAGPIVSALCNKYGCRAVCIAGSIIGCVAFIISTFSTNVTMLMITYGVIGGFGFGMIYLPAVVAVGYYFETKRSLATGIAVCGSGVGTFAFAPFASYLIEELQWKGSLIILAGLILNCAVFGALMRPLTYPKEKKVKPLMQRMYEEKQHQLQRGSIAGSYFTVQLPDGTYERRMKLPLNVDPGVHSSLNLEALAQQQGGLPSVPTLPTISESKVIASQQQQFGSPDSQIETRRQRRPTRHSESESTDSHELTVTNNNMPRNASQPSFLTNQQGLPKNGSVPFFDRVRKHSTGEKFKPTLSAIRASSRGELSKNGEATINVISMPRTESQSRMVRPMSRKDIFYSGSVTNLPQYQSQKSLADYRNSVLSLTKYEKSMRDLQGDRLAEIERERESYDLCPCLVLPESFKSALNSMLDVSLLKDPVFMMIGISNVFGMAALYIPFVYLVEAAKANGIEAGKAAFLISIIGIVNTFARIICGYIADFPSVNSLFLNNICLVIATISVAVTPLCTTYGAYIAMSIFFGIAIAGYISLTSIILVDLLGLDKLTNAFGLLILFRGFAAIIGSPLAGAIYDATESYDIAFYMAGGLFGISTITSFLVPLMNKCKPHHDEPIHMDPLTPIEEDAAEDDDDKPITMIPKIKTTLASPDGVNETNFSIKIDSPDKESLLQSHQTSTPAIVPKTTTTNSKDDKEINQRESVL